MNRRSRTLATALAFPAFVLLTTLLLAVVLAAAAPALPMESPEQVAAPTPAEAPPAEPVPSPVDPDAPPDAVESARQAARGLMQSLLGELSAALAEGGPTRAVAVCADRAPEIAAVHSGEGVEVGRTSQRLRNPDNAPDDFEAAWLERLAGLHRAGEMPSEVARVVEAGEGRELRYLKPIVIQADLCLQCHGDRDALSPEVRRILDERYPRDQATGYEKGDFRGLVTVRLPLPPDPS